VFLNFLHDPSGSVAGQPAVREAHCEDLVGADGWIGRTSIYHVVQATELFVPKKPVETPMRDRGHVAIAFSCSLIPEPEGQVFHNAQRVVPESLNFDRFAATRRYHPVADFGVHPRELDSQFAGSQQAAGIHFDSVARAASVPGDAFSKHGVEFVADELQVARIREVCPSASRNQRAASTVVYSGVSPASGKRFGNIP
jgi:hypothetical protein